MRIIALATAIVLAFSSVTSVARRRRRQRPTPPASWASRPPPPLGQRRRRVGHPAGRPETPVCAADRHRHAAPRGRRVGTAQAGYITTTDGIVVPVFGTELFSGAFAGSRPGDRPDYRIQPGDQISISLYGALTVSAVQPVDATGNVFIPAVGPTPVAGIPVSQLQSTLQAKVQTFYTSAVGVYATVVQAGSIGVFVTGDVMRPGRFLGGSNDSVLYFLSQAGGIDPARGCFRNITVNRNGAPIATYDLYDFLLLGQTQPMKFQDGDVDRGQPARRHGRRHRRGAQRLRLRGPARGQDHDRRRPSGAGAARGQRHQRGAARLPQRRAAVGLFHPRRLRPGGAAGRRPRRPALRRLPRHRHGQASRARSRARRSMCCRAARP